MGKSPKTTVLGSQTAYSGVAISRAWAMNVRIAYLRHQVARKPCLFLYGGTWHATQVVLVSYKAGIARRETRWCWFDPQAKCLFVDAE